MKSLILLFICLFYFSPLRLSAAEGQPIKSTGKNVLDFEGDVIEGERKRPDLFLEMKTNDLNLDEVLYSRDHFNDFLTLDKNNRPGFNP